MRYTFTKKPAKVAAAASKDLSRPALTAAWYDPEAGELRATDSYIAVRMPVEPDPGDVAGWIGADALERSRKRDGGGIASNGAVRVYDTMGVAGERTAGEVDRLEVASFPRPDLGDAPKLVDLWPADGDGFTVGINAGFLKRLSDALGADNEHVVLTFQSDEAGRPNPLKAIIVRTQAPVVERADGCSGVGAPVGLIMPVRV